MLEVREIRKSDVPHIIDYWEKSTDDYLISLGVDLSKMHSMSAFKTILEGQIDTPIEQRKTHCLIWVVDGKPIGHTNANPINYGEEAYMHLHIWRGPQRRRGLGAQLVKMSLPLFFEHLQLKRLFCQPYALNDAPNKTLEKVGFEFVKEYVTVPGSVNFEQPVKLWKMTRERLESTQSG